MAISQKISWTDVGREAAGHLDHILSHGTSTPPAWELPAAKYLLSIFEREGISATVLPPGSGADASEFASPRPNLIAHVPGGEADEPILLLSHLDSAPRLMQDWDIPVSTSGTRISGPGALMGTHLAVAQAMALILIARSGLDLRRTIRLAATSEGAGGRGVGLRTIAEHHLEHITSDIALGWGAVSWIGKGGIPYSLLTSGEKGSLILKIRSEGDTGKIGTRLGSDPVELLIRALNLLDGIEFEPRINESSKALARSISQSYKDFKTKELLDGLTRPHKVNRSLKALEENELLDAGLKAILRASLKTERFITRLSAVASDGLKPRSAEAVVLYSYPPGEDVEDVAMQVVEPLKSDGVYLAEKKIIEPSESEITPEIQALARASIKDVDKDARLVVSLSPWTTGHASLRKFGTRIFGWEPFIHAGGLRDTLAGRGGTAEKIEIDDLEREIRAYYSFLLRSCQ